MPKRIGYMTEEIVDYSNIYDSLVYVLRGKRKKSKSRRNIWKNPDFYVRKLQAEISHGKFRIRSYREHTINERGKVRNIQCIDLYHRIGLNAVMRVVEDKLNNRLILNTAASIKSRGCHWLLNRILHDIRKIPVNERYIRKDDISKFYESIPQELAKKVIRHYIKDKIVLDVLDNCIELMPNGISIGLRSSQFIGLLVLTYVIDHNLKDKLGAELYYRYCDDGLQIERSYSLLTLDARECHNCIENVGLKIKSNERFWKHEKSPIDFLGYTIYYDGKIRIRKHIKKRFAIRWERVKSNKRRVALLASFYGICKHANARHLFKKLTKIDMNTFSNSGFVYKSPDGKKRFDVQKYRLAELMNETIFILDYEDNVKNKDGQDRMIVKFQKQDGSYGKFWTGSEELKQALNYMNDKSLIPFSTTIKQKSIGNGKYMYIFR